MGSVDPKDTHHRRERQDKRKRAWNANCVQAQPGGDGGIRTHVPISRQNDFEFYEVRVRIGQFRVSF